MATKLIFKDPLLAKDLRKVQLCHRVRVDKHLDKLESLLLALAKEDELLGQYLLDLNKGGMSFSQIKELFKNNNSPFKQIYN